MDKKLMEILATQSPTKEQIGGLLRSQIGWLSSEQIGAIELLKAVPAIENLYTNILQVVKKEIENGGLLNQQTFGRENKGASVCGSPLCVGGATVWLAGEKGYELANIFGFETAATLIHRQSRPDAPLPRYDGSCKNENMMVFIQARAKEEQEGKV